MPRRTLTITKEALKAIKDKQDIDFYVNDEWVRHDIKIDIVNKKFYRNKGFFVTGGVGGTIGCHSEEYYENVLQIVIPDSVLIDEEDDNPCDDCDYADY